MRCPLGEKSRAVRVVKAVIKEAKNGKQVIIDEYEYSVLIVSTAQLVQPENLEWSHLLEQVLFYDSRATIESASIRGDRQRLKPVKRRKHRLAGQERLILLAKLAHNLIMRARGWLSEKAPKLAGYGIKRWVRDLLTVKGKINSKGNRILKVRLSSLHQLARLIFEPLAAFFDQIGIRLILSKK